MNKDKKLWDFNGFSPEKLETACTEDLERVLWHPDRYRKWLSYAKIKLEPPEYNNEYLEKCIASAFDPMKNWDANIRPPSIPAFKKAGGWVDETLYANAHKIKSLDTKLGPRWEHLMILIADYNPAFNNPRDVINPDGTIRDFILNYNATVYDAADPGEPIRLAHTYRSYVQSQRISKNGNGFKAIMLDAQGHDRDHVTCVKFSVMGDPRREVKEYKLDKNDIKKKKPSMSEYLDLEGAECFRFLSSTDPEMTNGDPTIYDRLIVLKPKVMAQLREKWKRENSNEPTSAPTV